MPDNETANRDTKFHGNQEMSSLCSLSFALETSAYCLPRDMRCKRCLVALDAQTEKVTCSMGLEDGVMEVRCVIRMPISV